MPLIFAFFVALVTSWAALQFDTSAALKARAGDVQATTFLIYQNALAAYVANSAPTDGTVTDASLSFPPGYVRNSAHTNVVSGRILYTWIPAANVTPGMVARLQQAAQYSVAKVTASGSALAKDGARSVPTTIPIGAIVLIGE